MKKFLLSIALALTLVLPVAISGSASAINVLSGPCPGGVEKNGVNGQPAPSVCTDNSYNSNTNPIFGPSGIMTTVVKILTYIVGVAAIIVIIIGAITLTTSGGDSSRVSEAKNAIIYALIGIVVAALGQVLVLFVLDKVQ